MMKKAKRRAAAAQAAAGAAARGSERRVPWQGVALALLALVTAAVYSPALNGEFVFDDLYLPFADAPTAALPLKQWVSGPRPLTMVSYWVNYRLAGSEPRAYHLTNLLFHVLAGGMVWLISRRVWETVVGKGVRCELGALLAAGIFLLHPVQTEAVAYVASRSENLSVFFGLAALAVFLGAGRGEISWARAVSIGLMLGLGVLSKEHIVAVGAVMVLTAWLWEPGKTVRETAQRTWRLLVLLGVGGVVAAVVAWRVMSTSLSAGFGLKEVTWWEYLLTQFRVIWVYLRLFVAPFGQSVDYGVAFSRSWSEGAVLAGGLGLTVVSALAWWKRREYPLAAWGWFAFLVLLAPTSSILPIRDALAERRLYLPMLGLLMVVLELLRRARMKEKQLGVVLSAVLVVLGYAAWQRNHVWASGVALWEDVAAKNPRNARARAHLGFAYLQQNRCAEAVRQFEEAARLEKPDAGLLVNAALAYSCANEDEKALEQLRKAAEMQPTAHVYSQIGMIEGKRGRREEARAALKKALELDGNFDATYVYLGHLAWEEGDRNAAADYYRKALSLNPGNDVARQSLEMAERSGGSMGAQ